MGEEEEGKGKTETRTGWNKGREGPSKKKGGRKEGRKTENDRK